MKNYPAKLLLLGEHTVNVGSRALALPLPLFSGKWAYAPHLGPDELAARQMKLPQLAYYLEQLQQRGQLLAQLDTAAFKQELAKGLVFESNIPTGYGAGSSGALVAAVLGNRRFTPVNWGIGNWDIEDSSLSELKQALAQMEAFFHGTSSGTDPLICFLQKPVLLGGPSGNVTLAALPKSFCWLDNAQLPPKGSHTIFLLDTGKPRNAAEFIDYFLKKMEGITFKARCQMSLNLDVDKAIDAFLDGDGKRLFGQVHNIGLFQLRFLPRLIPPKFHPLWKLGLEGDLFKLKVCGAGGGGFLLGITKDFETTKVTLAKHKLLPIMAI